MRKRWALLPLRHRPSHIPILLFFLDRLAFVVLLFAAGEAEFEFGAAVFPINGEGDEGGAFVFGFVFDADEFAFVDEEFLFPQGFVADVGFFVGVDVALVQDEFAALNSRVAFGELGFAVAEAFDFAAEEDHAAFDLVGDEILMERAAVLNARGEIGSAFAFHEGVPFWLMSQPRRRSASCLAWVRSGST